MASCRCSLRSSLTSEAGKHVCTYDEGGDDTPIVEGLQHVLAYRMLSHQALWQLAVGGH